MKNRLVALAILCAAIAGSLGAPVELGVLGLLLPTLAVIVGPRIKLGTTAEVATSFLVAFLGILAVRLVLPEPYKHGVKELSGRELLFLLPLLTTAGSRALLAQPRFGARLTLLLGLLALTAAGGALTGPAFPALATLFCLLALAALAAADPGRLHRLPATRQVVLATVLSALLVGGLALSSYTMAPALHAAVISKIQERLRSNRTGFSSTLELGDMTHMLEDSRVVLRLRGEAVPELLRGVVFTEYFDGRWFSTRRGALQVAFGGDAHEPRHGGIELEHASRPARYFLPRDAHRITPSVGGYSRDEFGIVYPPEDGFAKRVRFDRGATGQVPPPGSEDLRLPTELRAKLAKLAANWGAQHGSPAERLERLSARLQSYRYSLDSERHTLGDPVIDFLRHNPQGHCEYFASALALLARSVGVPTRLVSGYRVAEQSPFGYHIVRRLHAHSWVEAWLGERWVTYDPTPAVELGAGHPASTPLLAALVDALRTGWAAADDWLEQRTTFELALGLLVLGSLLVTVRMLRTRGAGTTLASDQQPLPGFVALDKSLARRGLPRVKGETLERFAARLAIAPALSAQKREQIAAALTDYARLRYAERGDSQAIDESLKTLARSV